MKALRLVAYGEPLQLDEVPDPVAGPGDAVIAVDAVGICRTDWHLWLGHLRSAGVELPLPVTLGHEVAGTVVETGSAVRSLSVGDRVTVPFHEACGHCAECRSGASNLCDDAQFLGSSHDGGFAEMLRVPRADFACVRLPTDLPAAAAATLGCRYMTAYWALVGHARAQPGEWVVVHAAGGGTGLATVQLAHAIGSRVVAVDVDGSKLNWARALGADSTVDAREDNAVEQILEATGGGGHVSVDALGGESTTVNSLRSLRPRGRHVQIGLTSDRESGVVAFPIDLAVHRELVVHGSSGCPHHAFAGLLSLIESGRCDPGRLIGREVSLHDVNDILGAMGRFETRGMTVVTDFA